MILVLVLVSAMAAGGQRRWMIEDSNDIVHLSQIYLRDVCILPDAASGTYYMVGPGLNSVRIYTSKDLKTWQGPRTIFRTPDDIWGDVRVVNIWAPEMHKYRDKYYLFLTFDTRNRFAVLEEAAKKDAFGRLKDCRDIMEGLFNLKDAALAMQEAADAGRIPAPARAKTRPRKTHALGIRINGTQNFGLVSRKEPSPCQASKQPSPA